MNQSNNQGQNVAAKPKASLFYQLSFREEHFWLGKLPKLAEQTVQAMAGQTTYTNIIAPVTPFRDNFFWLSKLPTLAGQT